MVAVPVTLVLRSDRQAIGALQDESEGLVPAQDILALIHLTQAHRHLATAVLGGNAALKGARETKQAEVSAAIAKVTDATAALNDRLLQAHRQQLQTHWKSLVDDVAAFHLARDAV
jgi:hypothetical protein